jgi:peptidoglycan/xylan/chitin deacetylase (PgdA/CDA1 family)
MSRRIACITLDVEADFGDPEGRIRLFEDEALLSQYVRLVERTGAKITAFLVTSLLDRYGDSCQRLGELIPVEFEIHSHAHDLRDPCSRADIEAAIGAFRGFAGTDPIGYRAPVGKLTREGLDTLLDLGFRYDSSIYPSLRPGKWGHNNLHLSVAPFRITRGAKSIIEVPFATLSGVRLDFSLSYVKLLGWRAYELLMKAFPLPDHIAVLTHPYDYYVHRLPYDIGGYEGRLLRRNAGVAFELLERMLRFLRTRGYEFALLSELCDHLAPIPLRELSIEKVIRERSSAAKA